MSAYLQLPPLFLWVYEPLDHLYVALLSAPLQARSSPRSGVCVRLVQYFIHAVLGVVGSRPVIASVGWLGMYIDSAYGCSVGRNSLYF